MAIALVTQRIIRTYPGSNIEPLELPADIARYFEFENTDVFLLYGKIERREIKIVGIQFSRAKYKLEISWQFQIIDGLGEIHEIVEMVKKEYEGKEVIYCRGWGFDIGYYLDPETGKILHTEQTK